MYSFDEKRNDSAPQSSHEDGDNGAVREVQATSVALAAAVNKEPPKLWTPNMIKLYLILGIGYLISTMNGYDSSLMGAINAMKPYQETFGLNGAGSTTGIVFITYNLGQIAAFPFCGLIADGWGRRWCIFVGCILVLAGTAIQATANQLNQFVGGRFVLGFGAAIASAAAPAYTVELAHPAYRGIMAGMYNNFWWLGNILAGWVTYGTNLHLKDSWAWRVPTVLQAGLPGISMCLILFFPESPRWLINNKRQEEGLRVLTKYHGNGNEQDPVVQLQYHEIVEQAKLFRDENPWWDYRELVNTRAARWRITMVIGMAFIGQLSGNNVVSYFMPEMIKSAGITDPNKQLLINAINPIFSMIAAIVGAATLDLFGRRTIMMTSLCGCIFSYSMLTAFTAQSEYHKNLAYGVIVFIYLFGIFFAWGFTPLQTLYSVECLENRTRAKGSGVNFLFLNIAMVINTYGIAEGIAKIGWKLYLIFIAWQFVELVAIYLFAVETAGKTLEEMGSIFAAKNPRKESTRKHKLEVNAAGEVVNVDHDINAA